MKMAERLDLFSFVEGLSLDPAPSGTKPDGAPPTSLAVR